MGECCEGGMNDDDARSKSCTPVRLMRRDQTEVVSIGAFDTTIHACASSGVAMPVVSRESSQIDQFVIR